MKLVQIYECLCDPTRLRLLNVLAQGPLCVCHFQAVLREPQVKISKHLAYLRSRGLVEVERQGNWMVYALPARPPRELKANLACLQDCAQENPAFRRDLARLKQLAPKPPAAGECGCAPRRKTTARTASA
jgi:ArsR family transcriptional regulator